MTKKILYGTAVSAIAAIAAFNTVKNSGTNFLRDAKFANVEALASTENGDGIPGSVCYFNTGAGGTYTDFIPCEGSVGTIYPCKDRTYDFYGTSTWACTK